MTLGELIAKAVHVPLSAPVRIVGVDIAEHDVAIMNFYVSEVDGKTVVQIIPEEVLCGS